MQIFNSNFKVALVALRAGSSSRRRRLLSYFFLRIHFCIQNSNGEHRACGNFVVFIGDCLFVSFLSVSSSSEV